MPPTPATGTDGRASEPAALGARDIANEGGIPGVPACVPGDGRRGIPVWAPQVRGGLQVTPAPPREAGQIVFLRLDVPADALECRDAQVSRFTVAADGVDHAQNPAASISVRGNTQQIDQVCRFSGLYRNETTSEAKTDAVEAAFVAMEPADVVSTNQYCLTSRPPPDTP